MIAKTNVQPSRLSILKRIKVALRQDHSVVLHRLGRNVTKVFLPAYFASESFLRLRDFEHCVECSLSVYKEDIAATDDVHVPEAYTPLRGFKQICFENEDSCKPATGFNLSGLRYQIWYKKSGNMVIIAFRGTRFSRPQDWYANFRWVTRFIPGVNDYYSQVQALIPHLVEHLRLKFGEKLTILTTGHSLGGGLAQHAAYCSEHISIVHAFAPTPVTGYFSVPKAEREKNKENTIIVRSFEHGEILAYLRFFMRRLVMLSAVNPEINELRFNASRLPPVTSHSMARMAEHLRRCLKEARTLSEPNIAHVLADTSSKSISNKSDSSQKEEIHS